MRLSSLVLAWCLRIYAGTLNERTIWSMSPFFGQLMDGTFAEKETCVVPYLIGGEEFKYNMYILVDGIYPHLIRFVHCIKEAIQVKDKIYTAWQEGARKDIERAFGILQSKWQCLARPMHQINLEQIGARMTCCMILHNMCVSDRIMGDVMARYDPSFDLHEYERIERVKYPKDLAVEVQGVTKESDRSVIGGSRLDPQTTAELARIDKRRVLHNKTEFIRIHNALSETLNARKRKRGSH
jgi:hypothetical protein